MAQAVGRGGLERDGFPGWARLLPEEDAEYLWKIAAAAATAAAAAAGKICKEGPFGVSSLDAERGGA